MYISLYILMAVSKKSPESELHVVLIKGDVFDRTIFSHDSICLVYFGYKYLSHASLPLLLRHTYVTLAN